MTNNNLINNNEINNEINNDEINNDEINNDEKYIYKCKKCDIIFSTDKKYLSLYKLCIACYREYSNNKYNKMSENDKKLRLEKQKKYYHKKNNYMKCEICGNNYKSDLYEKHINGDKHNFYILINKYNDDFIKKFINEKFILISN